MTLFRGYAILETMINITSKDNKILRHTKKLTNNASYRDKSGEFIAEGERLCAEALICNAQISYCIVTAEFLIRNPDFQKKLDDLKVTIYTVSENLFNSISRTQHPQGVLFVIRIPSVVTSDFAGTNRILILDGISEPGNMGTIIRTADAFGFGTVILCNNCVDIYNPKVVRSTMGGIFRTNFICANNISKTMEQLKSAGFQIAAAVLDGATDITEIKFSDKLALAIGSEANGASAELLAGADSKVKIPMVKEAESLNAAVAAGIAMFIGRE